LQLIKIVGSASMGLQMIGADSRDLRFAQILQLTSSRAFLIRAAEILTDGQTAHAPHQNRLSGFMGALIERLDSCD